MPTLTVMSLGDDHALAPEHPAVTDMIIAASGYSSPLHAACGQRSQFQQRATHIQQPVHPFAGQQLATSDVMFPRMFVAYQGRSGKLVIQLRHQSAVLVGERRRSVGCHRVNQSESPRGG